MQPPLPFEADDAGRPRCATVFVRHPRARRYIVRVCDDGTVRVTMPIQGRSARHASSSIAAALDRGAAHPARGTARACRRGPGARARARAWRGRAVSSPTRLLELAASMALSVSRVSVGTSAGASSCRAADTSASTAARAHAGGALGLRAHSRAYAPEARITRPDSGKLVAQACPDYSAREHGCAVTPRICADRDG